MPSPTARHISEFFTYIICIMTLLSRYILLVSSFLRQRKSNFLKATQLDRSHDLILESVLNPVFWASKAASSAHTQDWNALEHNY